MKSFWKSAFTLTEVMITVGIIGVVAALTVPNIINNYQKNALEVSIRKVMNEFDSAFDMYLTEEGKTKLSSTVKDGDINGWFDSFMTSKMKVVNNCSTTSCFADKYARLKDMAEEEFSCNGFGYKSYLLANSAAICLTNSANIGASAGEYIVYIDTNGKEGPNIGGRDMFEVFLSFSGSGGLSAVGSGWSYNIADEACNQCYENFTKPGHGDLEENCKAICSSPRSCGDYALGDGCLKQLMDNNWKMDY